jgi:hypothetical protein
MDTGAWMMVLALAIAIASLFLVVFALVRSIRNESTAGRSVWQEFGLGLSLMILFFATWIAQAIAEWQVFTDEQRSHGEDTSIGDFVSTFGQSTFENWQSEFLQLFTFVALAALFIHKGSAESKDSDEKLEASLRRIETHLGTLPPDAPSEPDQSWKLPDTPIDIEARPTPEATP